ETKKYFLVYINDHGIVRLMKRQEYLRPETPEGSLPVIFYDTINSINSKSSLTKRHFKDNQKDKIFLFAEIFLEGYNEHTFTNVVGGLNYEFEKYSKEIPIYYKVNF